MSTLSKSQAQDSAESDALCGQATSRAGVLPFESKSDLSRNARRADAEAGGHLQSLCAEGMPEKESLQHVYRAAPIGLCYLDTKLSYLFVNEWLAAINGLPVEEHIGRSVREVLPDVAAGVETQLRRVIKTGEPIVGGTVEAETAAQPGVKKFFEHHYDAVRSDDGVIVGVSCVVQDVTERTRAEQALRFTQFAVDHNSEATFWIKKDASFFYANRAACQTLGYTREELTSMTVPDIDPDFEHVDWVDHWQREKEAQSMTFEGRHRTKAGRVFPVEILTSFLEYDGQEYICAFVRDITQRKRAEQEIQANNAVLEGLTRVQREFLVEPDPRQSFERMLALLLEVTASEYGFIGEVLHQPGGQPYLKTRAITNIAWNDDTRVLRAEPSGGSGVL